MTAKPNFRAKVDGMMMGARKIFRLAMLLSVFGLVACFGNSGSNAENGVTWDAATLVETNATENASNPQVAIDSNGNAIAVWVQNDGTRDNIWANRYVDGLGWGSAEPIEMDDTGDAWFPQVAVDDIGNAIAIWRQFDGSYWSVWANRYSLGAGWDMAELLEAGVSGDAWQQQIAMDANGNAIVVWLEFDGANNYVWSKRYVAGVGWTANELVDPDPASFLAEPRVKIDKMGNAIVVWSRPDISGSYSDVWANRYVIGVGWGSAELLDTNDSGDAKQPQVGVDDIGNAVVLWQQWDGTTWSIWANHYSIGEGWKGAEFLGSAAADPQVAMVGDGDAVVVWTEFGDAQTTNIQVSRFVASTGWGALEYIEATSTDSLDPQIAVDGQGNAIAVWRQFDSVAGFENVWVNRYDVNAGWGLPMSLQEPNTRGSNVQVTMNAAGDAMVVWAQAGIGVVDIWARYLKQ